MDYRTSECNRICINRTTSQCSRVHILFKTARGTFSKMDHMLSYKASLGNFKKTEIISSIFSNHNRLRLEINYKEKKTAGVPF